jgi:hypothetical protein
VRRGLLSTWLVLAAAFVALCAALPSGAQVLEGRLLHAEHVQPGAIVVTSPFNNVLMLDGAAAQATAEDSASLDLGDTQDEDFTLEAFVYVPDQTSDASGAIFSKQDAYELGINFNPGTPDVISFKWWAQPSGVGDTLFGQANLATGWHHIAAVFDNEFALANDRTALFVDGVEIASTIAFEVTPGIYNSAAPLMIGTSALGGFFGGRIDEARFSDTVRYSGSYIAPSAAFTPDTATRALWHFDEAVCSISFADASGNGNTLTAANGAHTAGANGEACLPDAPTGLIATAGEGLVNLSWTASVSNGGSPMVGYVVTPYVNGVAQTPVPTANVTTLRLAGLTNGTTYTFTVAGRNLVGIGPESAPSNAVTPTLLPNRVPFDPPSNLGRATVPGIPSGLGPRVPPPH